MKCDGTLYTTNCSKKGVCFYQHTDSGDCNAYCESHSDMAKDFGGYTPITKDEYMTFITIKEVMQS